MKRRNFIRTTALSAAGLTMTRLYAMEPRIDRFTGGKFCIQPESEIPVIAEVDVLIAGATLGGIAAASSAAGSGASVFVVGYLPYPGEDICGTYRHLFNPGDQKVVPREGGTILSEKLFGASKALTPMHVKTVLEKELIDNNIDFLYCSYVSDIIFSRDDQPAGVVISNRNGCQAILCKSIVDCTAGAYVARLAGARFTRVRRRGDHDFSLVVVGNNGVRKNRVTISRLSPGVVIRQREYPVLECTASFAAGDFSFSRMAAIEQEMRDRTWDTEQVDSADHLCCDRFYRLNSKGRVTRETSRVEELPVSAFVPENAGNLFVCGPCADIPENTAREIISPLNQLKLGENLGAASFAMVSSNPPVEKRERNVPAGYYTKPVKGAEYLDGITGEISESLRPNLGTFKVRSERTALPVLGEYDVVVVGGGTAGAPAAISASRNGARTLLVEYLHGLGGTGTLGMIGRYWYGHRDGFTSEIDRGVREMADSNHPRHKPRDYEWVKDWKMEWYRREIRKAGGDIWFGVIASGAFVSNGKVTGVLVATPEGRGVILAKQVIDSTGNADIAIAAGAEYEYVGESTVAVQGSGLPKVDPDDHYNNTDWTFVDDSDVLDVTRVFISGKRKFHWAYDLGKLPQTRERRRIIAEFMVSPIDMLNARRYEDTISYHVSNFDTHGFTVHPYFIIRQPDGGHISYNVDLPLRSLLPRGLDGIIVTGLGAGAHRDAMPVIRMQPCLQNQGYAVGCLAALLVKENTPVRRFNLKSLQKHLVELGNLPERVLTDRDNMPPPDSAFAGAIGRMGNNFEGMEVLFSDIERGTRYLKEGLRNSGDDLQRLNIAIALGVLGIDSGWELLASEIKAHNEWDKGWNFTGMHQFGHSMSRLDTMIIALGRCCREEALPVIIDKARLLTAGHYFSHFRAVSIAFESLGSAKAAPVLYNLLAMPGVTGHHVITRVDAARATVPSTEDNSLRNNALRELHLARALYRCGDYYGLGKRVLENYSNDLHGHYFRHAAGILGKWSRFA
jgi:ribulose 1,5-bisphosphate synthetase/thiazole synthase